MPARTFVSVRSGLGSAAPFLNLGRFSKRGVSVGLVVLLAACVLRLWLMPLGSSFWVDEMVTVFVVRHGTSDPSLTVAPQVRDSLYYVLPRVSGMLFGISEVSFRLPSLLAMGMALYLISRIAARLIHPQAAWFAVFACFALRGINDQAADARPYALGTCLAAASVLFLIRWLDTARWLDAILFLLFAALLWPVHLLFWPFYLVYGVYAGVRLIRRETPVTWLAAAGVFAALAIAVAPVAIEALALMRQAKAHVIVLPPTWRDLKGTLKLGRIVSCLGLAWLISFIGHWRRDAARPCWAALALIAGWWLIHPLALFAFSWLSGNSVFVARYLNLALPGAALAATAAAAFFIPSGQWKPMAAVLATGALLYVGEWRTAWPPHHNSNWRAAARAIDELRISRDTPVVYPSPFIEAKAPAWRPDYPLPGFLYAHIGVYPVGGKPYLLPFEKSPEGEAYAAKLACETLAKSQRFVIYGGDRNVRFWRDWFAARAELAGWPRVELGPFGDVDAVLFEKPAAYGARNVVRLRGAH